jgi:beta-aspartyl-dipeptidase (metallo-type)
LLAKARALELEGLSAFCTTGGYPVPTPTFTGSVIKDIVFVDGIVGLGELAIADFRSSHPTTAELARLASEAHMGGRLSGKGGVTILHFGDGKAGLGQLRELVSDTDLPLSAVLPTHVNTADRFGLRHKGRIRAGCDADMLLVDESLATKCVYARGRLMVENGRPVVRGIFETD